MMADFIAIGVRALAFIAALQTAGVALFLRLFGSDLRGSRNAIERLGGRTAVIGLLLALAHQVLAPGRLTGELSGVFDSSLQTVLLTSDMGRATAVRVVGLAIIVLAWFRPGRLAVSAGLIGSALVVMSFAFMGHTTTDAQRAPLAGLLILHLAVVAFWFGALWPLSLVIRHESLATSGRILERFSRIAVWLVPVILVAGLSLAALLLPSLATLQTPYGLLLVAKASGFALLMVLASLNKWRLGPRVSNGDGNAVRVLGGSLAAEWLLIAAVLTVTAVMTASFSPTH